MDEEKQAALRIIQSYIKRLEDISSNIDKEIESKYFELTCLGGDIESSGLYLYKKYHKKEWDDEK